MYYQSHIRAQNKLLLAALINLAGWSTDLRRKVLLNALFWGEGGQMQTIVSE